MDGLEWRAGWEIRDLILTRQITVRQVTEASLRRIRDLDDNVHAFITVCEERALRCADEADRRLMRGEPTGSLLGIPTSIKDLYPVGHVRTTAGSLVYEHYVPKQSAGIVERLEEAGAIIVGKTNTPEFGLGGRTSNLLMSETVNPWNRAFTAGGSSGGAAASVALGMTPFALGSDGGGSIRLPAAYCGVYGLHVSNGRVPRVGGFGHSLFLASAGIIARDVRDAAIGLQVIAQPDRRDPTASRSYPPDYSATLEEGVGGLRFGWWSDCGPVEGYDERVVAVAAGAAERLASLGNSLQGVGRLADGRHRMASDTLFNADCYAFLGQQLYEDPESRGLLSDIAIERFSTARQVTAAEYVRALRTRYNFLSELEDLFARVDLVLSPTTPTIAGPDITGAYSAFTSPVNLGGLTAVSVPCGFVDDLPVGLQIIGRQGEEHLVLCASRAFERLLPWTGSRGPLASRSASGQGDLGLDEHP